MEGYQGHNSNMFYALCMIPFMCYALSQSACQLYAFYILQNDHSDKRAALAVYYAVCRDYL